MNKLSFVLIILFSFFTFSETRNVTFEGKNFTLTLPDGYCDQTDKTMGLLFLPFLKKSLSNMSGPTMTPIMVFSECGHEFSFVDGNYPFGYVALQKIGYEISQIDLNNIMAEAVTDKSFVDEINKSSTKGNEKTFKDLGMKAKMKGISVEDNGWLYGDENVGIFTMINEGFVDGVVFKERVLTSSTVVGEYQIAVYITNDLDNDTDYEVLTYELAINGEILAENNR